MPNPAEEVESYARHDEDGAAGDAVVAGTGTAHVRDVRRVDHHGTTVPARHGRDRDLGWRGVTRMNTQELAAAIASTQ